MATENALLKSLIDKINNDTLVLPTLPAIAMRVREAAQDPEINLKKISNVIAMDPSLSARIIKLANSALYARNVKAETVNQAVNRIGLQQVKSNAMALAMEQLFLSSNALIKKYLDQVWERTVNVNVHTLPLYQAYQQKHRSKRLDPDVMALALLLHNIGILPILTEAERMGVGNIQPTFLNHAIQKLSGKIGGAITNEWEFDESVIVVAESWRNLKVQPENIGYIDFVRIGAVSAGYLASKRDEIIQHSIDKGIIDSADYLEDESYLQQIEEHRLMFEN